MGSKRPNPVDRTAQLANLASVASTILALAALVISLFTYFETTRFQKMTAAFTYWQTYLQHAAENPKFASGTFDANDPEEKLAYEWFVATSLGTAEAVYNLQDDDPGWKSTIQALIRTHQAYIRSPDFNSDHYSSAFVNFINETLPGR